MFNYIKKYLQKSLNRAKLFFFAFPIETLFDNDGFERELRRLIVIEKLE